MAHATRPRTFDPHRSHDLLRWLAGSIGARSIEIGSAALLSGGAIGENWRLDVTVEGGPHDGGHTWVLRTDAASRMALSHDRVHEFRCLQAAHAAGVPVPEPIACHPDRALVGAPFMIVGYLAGSAQARKIVRDPALPRFGPRLAEALGGALARLHSVRPPVDRLGFLEVPTVPPARARIALLRRLLDKVSEPRPALEYVLRWLDRNSPQTIDPVLVHGDFRTGNYMVDAGRLTGILDWEFTHWGDRHEDIGYFCARCWRFGNDALEAGGIARREELLRGYEATAPGTIDRSLLAYWEVMAAAAWAATALMQGERHLTGGERSLELLLTGMMAPEMELECLDGIEAMEGARRT